MIRARTYTTGLVVQSMMLALVLSASVSLVRAEPLFFAFDNGMTDVDSPVEKARLLKELGFDGIGSRPHEDDQELLDALDEHGLRMFSTYIVLQIEDGVCEVPASVVEHIERLAGRGTVLWVSVADYNKQGTDEIVLPALRHIAQLAEEHGLTVALYPHINYYTDTIHTCLRLVKIIDQGHVGVSFNLVHFLFQNEHDTLEATIREAAPYLKLLQISGASRGVPGETPVLEYIKPLDEGDFDVWRVIRVAEEIGYTGPVCLMGYGIELPAHEHLARSMKTWRGFFDE